MDINITATITRHKGHVSGILTLAESALYTCEVYIGDIPDGDYCFLEPIQNRMHPEYGCLMPFAPMGRVSDEGVYDSGYICAWRGANANLKAWGPVDWEDWSVFVEIMQQIYREHGSEFVIYVQSPAQESGDQGSGDDDDLTA